MKVILLAAGQGKRLYPYTEDLPKSLVSLGGIPLIHQQISVLQKANIKDIFIVGGYRAEKLRSLGFPVILNEQFASTNMLYSLMCAREIMDGTSDIIIAYADIVYEQKVLQALLDCREDICTTVDLNWLKLWKMRSNEVLNDAETLKFDENHNISEIGKKPDRLEDIQGQYMGLIKVKAKQARELSGIYQSLDPNGIYDGKDFKNMFMTSFLQQMIELGHPVRAVFVRSGWLEIDTKDELDLYNEMHRKGTLAEFYKIPERDEET